MPTGAETSRNRSSLFILWIREFESFLLRNTGHEDTRTVHLAREIKVFNPLVVRLRHSHCLHRALSSRCQLAGAELANPGFLELVKGNTFSSKFKLKCPSPSMQWSMLRAEMATTGCALTEDRSCQSLSVAPSLVLRPMPWRSRRGRRPITGTRCGYAALCET
jgi:hypothetical protein